MWTRTFERCAKGARLLVDTDVLIWLLRGRATARHAAPMHRAAAMLHLLLALRARVPSLFSELGFRVTLAWEKGVFLTFPDDFHEYIDDRLPAVRRFVAEHPGSWP